MATRPTTAGRRSATHQQHRGWRSPSSDRRSPSSNAFALPHRSVSSGARSVSSGAVDPADLEQYQRSVDELLLRMQLQHEDEVAALRERNLELESEVTRLQRELRSTRADLARRSAAAKTALDRLASHLDADYYRDIAPVWDSAPRPSTERELGTPAHCGDSDPGLALTAEPSPSASNPARSTATAPHEENAADDHTDSRTSSAARLSSAVRAAGAYAIASLGSQAETPLGASPVALSAVHPSGARGVLSPGVDVDDATPHGNMTMLEALACPDDTFGRLLEPDEASRRGPDSDLDSPMPAKPLPDAPTPATAGPRVIRFDSI